MAKQRYIKDSMWSDNWFTDIEPLTKLLYTYLLTNDKVTTCWVYEIPLKKIAYETWIDRDMIEKMLQKLESDWKVLYSNWRIALVNFIKNQSMNENMIKWAKREAQNINKEVWLSFANKKPFQTLSNAFKQFDILNLTLLNLTLPNGENEIPKKTTAPANAGDVEKTISEKEKLFDEFWKEYPNKKWVWRARVIWAKLVWVDYKEIIDCCKRFSIDMKGKEPRYIKNWDTWLTNKWREDYINIDYEGLYNAMSATRTEEWQWAYGQNVKVKYQMIWEWREEKRVEDKTRVKREKK